MVGDHVSLHPVLVIWVHNNPGNALVYLGLQAPMLGGICGSCSTLIV